MGDFRAPAWLVRAETEALSFSRRVVTPHSELAAIYRDKAVLLDWTLPSNMKKTAATGVVPDEMKVAYPAPTVGRKGAYELRAAVQGLGIRLVTVGAQLEGSDFWRGMSIEDRTDQEDWLQGVKLVVLPAFVEHKPRRLLQAVACGIPVIASNACGLENTKGVITVPCGNVETLRREIKKVLSVTKDA